MDADHTVADRATGLDGALGGLALLVAGDGPLPQLLTAVASLATEAIPGADGAGVTLVEPGWPDTVVGSAPFVREVDAAQYRLGEGPCISAVSARQTTTSGSLATDPAWPNFGPLANALGVSSVMSLPLVLADEVLGSLNVYALAPDAFSASAVHIGERFAGPAVVAMFNARRFEQAQRLTGQLEAALVNRAVIDQAIGIIRSRSGLTADEAFARLRVLSQHGHTKLAAVAAALVDEAVVRARARGSSDRGAPRE